MTAFERPEDVVTRLEQRLRDGRVRLELGPDLERIRSLQAMDGLATSRRLLVKAASDLQVAISEVSETIQRLRDLERTVRFTELGWPERRRELIEACASNPAGGIADWLEDWFAAIATVRLDACDRLTAMTPDLPAGVEVLVGRCRTTSAALHTAARGEVSDNGWDIAAPMLFAGARGIEVDGRSVPGGDVQSSIWVLLVRLALAAGMTAEARRALDEAAARVDELVFDALAERIKAAEDGAGSVRGDLMRLAADSPDALLEVARVINLTGGQGSADLRFDTGLTSARSAIASAASLDDAEERVRRMLEPVPAEIRLALAERALAEGDEDLASRSLEGATETQNDAIRAEIHERLAQLARGTGDEQGRRRELLAAAKAWDAVGRSDRTASLTGALLDLDADQVEARCLLAGSLVQLSKTAQTRDEALSQLRRALDVAEPVPSILDGGEPDTGDAAFMRAWASWTQSYAHGRLAAFDKEPAQDHRWRGVLAALRAVAYQPTNYALWLCLADAAYELRLWSMAESASGRAAEISPGREVVAEHIRALINLGEYASALEALGVPTNPYEWSLKGTILARQGSHAEAVAVFAEHPPEDAWARESQAISLLIAGHRAEAISVAKDLDAWYRGQLDERANRPGAVSMSTIIGDDDRVESLAAKVWREDGDHSVDYNLAIVRTRQGRSDEARALYRSYVGSFTSMDDVSCWENIDVPMVSAVLVRSGRPDEDLVEAHRALVTVKAELAARRDPLAELERADAGGADPGVVDEAKRLGRAIIAVARDDVGFVEEWLAASGEGVEGVQLQPLRDWASGWRRAEEAEAAVAATTRDDAAAASRSLTELLGHGSGEAYAALIRSDDPAAVLPALRTLMDDPSVGEAAAAVAGWLDPPPAAGDPAPDDGIRALAIELPASWFTMVDDPVTQHPLFRRHLAALRLLRQDFPGVNVRAEDDLEPSAYRIFVREEQVDAGQLATTRRVLPDGALELLPPAVAATAVPAGDVVVGGFGGMTIADEPDAELALPGLLSRSAMEVAVARLMEVAGLHSSELGLDEVAQPGGV